MSFKSLTPSNLEDKPELIDQTLNLIEQAFEYKNNHSFKIDFYPLFNEVNFKNCNILINDKNQVVAHIGRKKRVIVSENKEIDCSLWGGIAVDPKYRGKGLFKSYFNELQENENKETIQLLWSGTPEIYYSFGFELKHQQYEYSQKKSQSEFYLKNKLELTESEMKQVISLYEQKTKRLTMFKRTKQDWDEWKEVQSAELYLYKKDNEITSYFLKNKGQDLTNVIHEHTLPKELFSQALHHGNLWTAAHEFPFVPEQIYYLALFKNDPGIKNVWINGIDSI